MNFFKIYLVIILLAASSAIKAQQIVTAFDFEKPLNVQSWWVDNKDIIISKCDSKNCNQLTGSRQCLRIQWNNIPENKLNTWLTDIKIDTFGNQQMETTWNKFKNDTWLSFKANTADADSVYFQFIIFTKDEKDKWGSHEMTGFKSASWKTVKVKLSSILFDNWGKGNIAEPDLNIIIPARIEIGIRSAKANDKDKIDVRIDNIAFTNYEP